MVEHTKNDSIKHWPEDMRPREKLFKHGAHTLSDAELLALLLRTGHRGTSAVDLGRNILQEFGSLRELVHTDNSRWDGIKGVGKAKIAQIRAAFEIGKRLMSEQREVKGSLRSPEDIAEMFMPKLRDLKVELFQTIMLDGRNNILDVKEVTHGTPSQAVPHVRSIIAGALGSFAAGIVCVHNHPSGNTAPSRDDKVFTSALRDACGTMDIKLVDHIIIGDNSFFSFVEGGLL
ncbi:DNA repair protein RadC [Planctomycetota bacterium]